MITFIELRLHIKYFMSIKKHNSKLLVNKILTKNVAGDNQYVSRDIINIITNQKNKVL